MSESDIVVALFVVPELLDHLDQLLVQPRVVGDHLRHLVAVVFCHQSLHLGRMSSSFVFAANYTDSSYT